MTMSFLSRAVFVINVGATVTLKTFKYGRTTFKHAYSSGAFGVEKVVRLDTYEKRRENAEKKLQSASEQLRLRIVENLDDMNAINSRDIQELIFTANQDDVDLIVASLKKLQLQSDRMRFSEFNMDAVVMRMFAYLKLPTEASKTFLDEDFKRLFVGYNCIVILLDLLYRNSMFQEILDCLDCLEKRQNFNVWSSACVGSFYIAACLKINTPQTLEKGLKHFEKVLKYREAVPALTLLATLIALKSNPQKVDYFVNLLGDNPTYSDFKANVILQRIISAGKLSDVKEYLKMNKPVLAKDTYDLIATQFEKDAGNINELKEIVKKCKVLDLSLEDFIIHNSWVNPEKLGRTSKFNKDNAKRGQHKS